MLTQNVPYMFRFMRYPRPPSCLTAAQLHLPPEKAWVAVAGLVLVRQRPGTAKGVIFITLEDETGVANIVVWAKIYEKFRRQIIAGRLLRRVVDFAVVEGGGVVTQALADRSLTRLGVDSLGLDGADRRYLKLIAENYAGGPVGIETLSAALSESRDALEEVVEPYLLQQGLIQRTPRGRMLAQKAWTHLGMVAPRQPGQTDLFEG